MTLVVAPGSFRDGMTAMVRDYDDHGFPGDNALVLHAALGREPRSIRNYLEELAGR